jgi:diacylglycerol kinase family enzyme
VSSGDHVGDERVTYFRTPDVDFTFARTIKVNTDGQVLDADRCRYRVLPGAVRVRAPRAFDAGTRPMPTS